MEISNLVVDGVSVDCRIVGQMPPTFFRNITWDGSVYSEFLCFHAVRDTVKDFQVGDSLVASFTLHGLRVLFCGEVVEKTSIQQHHASMWIHGYRVRGKVTESDQSPSPPHSGRCGGGGGEASGQLRCDVAQLMESIANDIESHNGMPYELHASMLEWLPQLRDMVVRLRRADVNGECMESDQCWLG